MKELDSFLHKIEKLIEENAQYKYEAYSFVLAALHYASSSLKKPRHITGRELLEGIRKYSLDQFGPLAKTVLNYWGIHETADFGKIVFGLVDAGVLRKQPEDKIEDFENVYSFDEAFHQDFEIEDDPST
ncbi:MAG: hypothetical protein Q8R76_01895 [Candidatus Omnitrophota bacterium]|nr:hypothetical protein [Candidatus Omnitrophota bacterium]